MKAAGLGDRLWSRRTTTGLPLSLLRQLIPRPIAENQAMEPDRRPRWTTYRSRFESPSLPSPRQGITGPLIKTNGVSQEEEEVQAENTTRKRARRDLFQVPDTMAISKKNEIEIKLKMGIRLEIGIVILDTTTIITGTTTAGLISRATITSSPLSPSSSMSWETLDRRDRTLGIIIEEVCRPDRRPRSYRRRQRGRPRLHL